MRFQFIRHFLVEGTEFLSRSHKIVTMATGSQSKIYSAIVLACGFIFAISLSLILRPRFEFQGNLDVISWITVNKYPKQQEMFYYIASLIFIPLFAIATWIWWLLYSNIVSYITKLPLHHTLKKYAFTHLPFILVLRNIHTPTFSKMLLMPLVLFLSAEVVFLTYDLFRTRFRRFSNAIFYKESSNLHWSIFTSGICVSFFVLIGYSNSTRDILSCLKVIFISSSAIWLFWLVYSGVLSLIIKRPFRDILTAEVYSYFPLVILLSISLFFEYRDIILIISIVLVALVKMLIVVGAKHLPSRENASFIRFINKCFAPTYHKYILEYILIPSLIYVLFYSGGNIHGGIDMFHEGERLAPLNELLHGAIPYRDIYLQHGLFYSAYRPLLSAKLFGPTLAADRLLGHILDPLGYVAFYIFALQVFRSKLSAFLLIWILSSGVSEDFVFWNPARRTVYTAGRLAPAYMSIALVAIYVLNQHRRTICRLYLLPILSGVCSVIAIFNSLEMGLYATTTCFLFLLILSISMRISLNPPLEKGNFRLSSEKKSFGLPLWKRGLEGFSPTLSYLAGIFIAFLPIAIYFAIHGALDDLLRNSYIQVRYQSAIWGLRFPPLFPELSKVKSIESLRAFILSDTFKWYLPILIYLITLTYLAYQVLQGRFWKAKSNVTLLLLAIGGIIFFRTMLGRSDTTHLYGISFAWMIGMFLIESLFIRLWKELKMDFSVSVSWHSHVPISTYSHPISVILWRACLILLLFWYATSVYNPIDTVRQLSVTLTGYRNIERHIEPPLDRAGGIRIPADQASQIKAVVEYIQSSTSPDETIFDFSNQGGYYFFADRPSASKYHQVCYASTEAMQKEVIGDLELHKTRLVIFSNSSWMDAIDGVSNLDRHWLIAKYLKENYIESARIGPTIIMKRKLMVEEKR